MKVEIDPVRYENSFPSGHFDDLHSLLMCRISLIIDCSLGSNLFSEFHDDDRMLTMTVASEGDSPRTVAFKVPTREERNLIATCVR